jgi:hypothetical protein
MYTQPPFTLAEAFGEVKVSVTTGQPLDELAETINTCLRKSEDYRVRAGIHLAEVRARIAAGELGDEWTWRAWCATNIKRSMRDINRCLALANAPDPEAAVAKERANAREGMAVVRAAASRNGTAGTNVRPDDNENEPMVQPTTTKVPLRFVGDDGYPEAEDDDGVENPNFDIELEAWKLLQCICPEPSGPRCKAIQTYYTDALLRLLEEVDPANLAQYIRDCVAARVDALANRPKETRRRGTR